jgi:pSer/pThr/pTyr-binding forkhead associated (FHA) protein
VTIDLIKPRRARAIVPGAGSTGPGLSVERQMEAKLIVVGGKAPPAEFSLNLPTIIGRSRAADIPLNHPLISRQHCELFEANGQLMVRDLGSLNGTFIGNNRITDEIRLAPGSLLTVGAFTFRAVYEAAESDEDPDFSTDDPVESDDATIDEQRSAADTGQVGSEKSDPAFNMSWLGDGAEDDSHDSAAKENAPDSPADLMPPSEASDHETTKQLDFGDDEEDEAVKKVERGAKPSAKQEVAKSANTAKNEKTEPAPAAEKPAAGGAEDEEDLDDFFRSLSEP